MNLGGGNQHRGQQGQVIIEYVLILAVVVTSIGLMARALRTNVFQVWTLWTKEIAAPCSGCQPPPEVR